MASRYYLQSGLEAMIALTGTHIMLTITSDLYGIFASAPQNNNNEVFDARHYQNVTKFVKNMYSSPRLTTEGVQLSESVTFEDAHAICRTSSEVNEAFRALQALNPQCLSDPTCVNVQPKAESIEFTYSLHQKYAGSVTVRSLLVLDAHLVQIKGDKNAESNFEITRMEERWNGIEPLSFFPFWVTRRVNGIISWHLTRRFVN